jgi:hypothetical protein
MLFLQNGLRLTPMQAGLTMLPWSVMVALFAGFSAVVLLPKIGRAAVQLGLIVLGVAFALIAYVGAAATDIASWWPLLTGVVIGGAGMGMVVAPLAQLTLGDVPVEDAGSGSALFNTFTQLAASVGVAVIGLVFFTEITDAEGRAAGAVMGDAVASSLWLGMPEAADDRSGPGQVRARRAASCPTAGWPASGTGDGSGRTRAAQRAAIAPGMLTLTDRAGPDRTRRLRRHRQVPVPGRCDRRDRVPAARLRIIRPQHGLRPTWRLLGVITAHAQALPVAQARGPALTVRDDVVGVPDRGITERRRAHALLPSPQQAHDAVREEPAGRCSGQQPPLRVRVDRP